MSIQTMKCFTGANCTLLLLLLSSTCVVIRATLSDIRCLKFIQDSLEDPLDYLNSWDFNNFTEGFICSFAGINCWHPDENRVLAVDLSGLGLKGEFPRGIQYCNALTGLNLSGNELFGSIPSDISKILSVITSLDLSHNSFSGEIPVGIVNCSYLNDLRLNSNKLTGRIPVEIGQLNRIKTFSVANNFLSGPIPEFVTINFTDDSAYANNTELCGRPLEPCGDSFNPNSFDRTVFINGFLVGWASMVGLIFYVSLNGFPFPNLFQRRRIPHSSIIMDSNQELAYGEQWQSGKDIIIHKEIQIPLLDKSVVRMHFGELSKAANCFSLGNIIGIGKTGITYTANLINGRPVAIKWLHDTEHAEDWFLSELTTLGRLKDNNLTPLIGFCLHSNKKLIVYEYMSNGNLYDLLHEARTSSKFMDWPARVKIACGIARGLTWLHHSCNFTVFHNKICSKSVLLDEEFEPRLSNFWDAKFINFKWSSSNWNPCAGIDFWELGFYKKDVYDFGTMLLELITGRDPNESIDSERLITETRIKEEADEFLRISCECVHLVPAERPTMLDVYRRIQAIQERYISANDSQPLMVYEFAPADDTNDSEN